MQLTLLVVLSTTAFAFTVPQHQTKLTRHRRGLLRAETDKDTTPEDADAASSLMEKMQSLPAAHD